LDLPQEDYWEERFYIFCLNHSIHLRIHPLYRYGLHAFFVLERFLHWHHNHTSGITSHHVKPFGTINLIADMFHNFLDGILISASFSYSFEIGIATTIIVIMHELPQEIGDFWVLIHADFSRRRALIFNFLYACTAFVGANVVLLFNQSSTKFAGFILPFAGGGFIYLTAADLIHELHAEKTILHSIFQFVALLSGMALLYFITWIDE
jgi:zinc and cadmium transporter